MAELDAGGRLVVDRRPAGAYVDAALPTRRDFLAWTAAACPAVAATPGTLALIQSARGQQEQARNPRGPTDTEPVTLPSAHGTAGTVERLKALPARKGVEVFAHIDHAAGAEKVGLSLRPTQVLIFGDPRAGTPLMQAQQTIGLDLPLRVLAWEDESAKAWLTYRPPGLLARRHHVAGHDEAARALDDGLAGLARAATAKESGR